ncbi:MAG: phosphatidylserine decarboxylase family protein [Bacteroidota bacterium]|jgi:phosphatidylserine decarboxylase|nr:MAG: phosphatidylserine decarboxylase family protein [Bacteroidota bacterium]
MTIHKEGRTLLFILLLVLFAINWLLSYLFPENALLQQIAIGVSIVLYFAVLQFFRNPKVVVELNDKQILAPADGKIVAIEETEETEYLKERRTQISIFMSPINVHVNRLPVGGVVSFYRYHPGRYLVAWHPKSSTENERTTLAVRMASGLEILVRQIAGAVARRIRCYVKEGQPVNQGEEFGFIKFGSRVDVFVPTGAQVRVAVGDRTVAGKTVLAELN